jgi:hypothetical protein
LAANDEFYLIGRPLDIRKSGGKRFAVAPAPLSNTGVLAMVARIVSHFRRFSRMSAAGAVFGSLLFLAGLPARAERPSSMKLFPEETLVFIRMANAYEFAEGLKNSSTGRMLADPQVKPFIEQLYGDAAELYAEKAEQFMGISWEDLQ